MKKILTLLLLTLVVFTSCKKDESLENATSVADIQRVILEGYWQADKFSSSNVTLEDYEYFYVFKFNSNTQYDNYYDKAGEYTELGHYYRLRENERGKAIIVFYDSEADFEENSFEDYDVYEVSITNGDLVLVNNSENKTYIFKKYKSIADVKNLPTGL